MAQIDYKKLPASPGIYIFADESRKPLYIGKAVNLRNRVKSYFKDAIENPRIKKMVESATRLKFIRTGSEIEALILESKYIKKHRPKFNITMRDDKQYFYAGITKEDFPKIFLAHQTQNSKIKAEYVGPFTDGGALKTTLRLLRRIFPYCSCKQKHQNHCLNYHIGNCPGYCCLVNANKKFKTYYRKNISAVKRILSGRKNALIKNIKAEMMESAKKEDFEKSIELRKQMEGLEKVFKNAKIIKELALKESRALADIQRICKLNRAPQRIEGYDVSNIYGSFATASMIVFANGEPDKNEYRRFKIKIDGRANDTAMIRETLKRRLGHLEWSLPDLILIDGGRGQLNSVLSVLKDGRLSIPIIALAKDKKHKGSHIYSSVLDEKMDLKNLGNQAKNLILHIDAEAHRFAISYYRKLHKESLRK